MLRTALLLLSVVASRGGWAPNVHPVVISVSRARYSSVVRVLDRLNLTNIYKMTPQTWSERYVRQVTDTIVAPEGPDSTRRHVSYALAYEDLLGLLGLRTDEWWLVFEDDIEMDKSITLEAAQAAVARALELARDDGVAHLGLCIPLACRPLEAVEGIHIDRCTSYCSHAYAWHSSQAHRWRRFLMEHRAKHVFHAADWILLDASRSVGGFVTVGRNLAGEPKDAYGIIHQNLKWGSIMNAA